ncbi:HEAT repeat domain-containing protein [Ammonicoccus fulvus]|uniref:HEAT repeat domain-containing protein n=1 Tax=Ammonicoccus fulvus TaxID=3138240 RepID=A0ABZ3FL45_9ACTN
MTDPEHPDADDHADRLDRVRALLDDNDPSIRLRTVMAMGARPHPDWLEPLIARCGIEPDFGVRDTLSWALLHLPKELTLPRLQRELGSFNPQARSQALHTLSKIGDPRAWEWITTEMVRDRDDEVALTAWRAAAALAPEDARASLAEEFTRQLGRGDSRLQQGLTRAFRVLDEASLPALDRAANEDPATAAAIHARATAMLIRDPELTVAVAFERAAKPAQADPEEGQAGSDS